MEHERRLKRQGAREDAAVLPMGGGGGSGSGRKRKARDRWMVLCYSMDRQWVWNLTFGVLGNSFPRCLSSSRFGSAALDGICSHGCLFSFGCPVISSAKIVSRTDFKSVFSFTVLAFATCVLPGLGFKGSPLPSSQKDAETCHFRKVQAELPCTNFQEPAFPKWIYPFKQHIVEQISSFLAVSVAP